MRVNSALKYLIPTFIKNRHKDVQSIGEALNQGDYEIIQNLAHNMKGSGGGYGFDAISDIGAHLEQAAKDRSAEEVQKWVSELATYLERVEVVYE